MPTPESEAPPLLTGGCGCGAVRYVASGAPRWAAHCHCRDCRRYTGAAFATYAGFARARVRWTADEPRAHRSSPGVVRRFCGTCGTPLSYESERWPDELHIVAGTLDDPAAIAPAGHVYTIHRLPWIELADGLPCFATVPSDEKAAKPPASR